MPPGRPGGSGGFPRRPGHQGTWTVHPSEPPLGAGRTGAGRVRKYVPTAAPVTTAAVAVQNHQRVRMDRFSSGRAARRSVSSPALRETRVSYGAKPCFLTETL